MVKKKKQVEMYACTIECCCCGEETELRFYDQESLDLFCELEDRCNRDGYLCDSCFEDAEKDIRSLISACEG